EERAQAVRLRAAHGGAEVHDLERARQVARAALEGLDARAEELARRVGVGAITEARGEPGEPADAAVGEARDQGVEVAREPLPGRLARLGLRELRMDGEEALVGAEARIEREGA